MNEILVALCSDVANSGRKRQNVWFLISIVYTRLSASVPNNFLTEKIWFICILYSDFSHFLCHDFYKFIKVYRVGTICVNLERRFQVKSSFMPQILIILTSPMMPSNSSSENSSSISTRISLNLMTVIYPSPPVSNNLD